MCPKRSDAAWDLLPQNARTDFAAAQRSEIHRSICSSEKKPQRAKHLKHVLSLVALIFFTTSPSKSRLKTTTTKKFTTAATYDWCTRLVFNSCCLYSTLLKTPALQYPALHHLQSTCSSLSPANGQIFRRSAFFCTRSRNSGPREHLLYSIETQVMVKIHAQQRSGESLCIVVDGAFLVDKVLQAMYSRTPI